MAELFEWKSKNSLFVRGVVDENFALNDVFKSSAKEVWVDFSEMTRMNSHGVRAWLNAFIGAGIRVHYVNAPVMLAEQFSIVPEFLHGNSVVESFDALYVCSACGRELISKLTVGVDVMPQSAYNVAPRKPCPGCGSVMDFDHDPEEYFKFLLTMAV